MTDPVQVVTEAREAHRYIGQGACSCGARRSRWADSDDSYAEHVNEAIVAALKAAGALMPEEAQKLRDEVGLYSTERWVERDHELQEAKTLLQEALSVLGQVREEIASHDDEGRGRCTHCGDLAPCGPARVGALVASLAEKIEESTGGEG